jgi:hypothetical protein
MKESSKRRISRVHRREREEDMKQRKRGIRRMFAGAMAALMMLSVVDVSGWGVMNAKAEETAEITLAENAPQYLYVGDGTTIAVIWDGKLQDDGKDNKNTIYQGNGWYYDGEENQLVLQGVSITNLSCDRDLSILLSGTNNVEQYIQIEPGNSENEHTLTIKSDNNGSLICESILAGSTRKPRNLSIMGATVETSEIRCHGSLAIENSHIAVNNNQINDAILGNTVSIKDSYVKAKSTEDMAGAISSKNGITISDSQILAEIGKTYEAYPEDSVIKNVDSSNSVITKQWKDYEKEVNVTKTYVYGKATLKEDLTIASGESIEFESGASITNPEKLTLADGASLLVDGEEHTHNKDGDVTYTWKDDKEHIKNVACKDCPIGYVTKETESHSIGENGFCACNEVYQSAKLTTDKYDIDGDDSKDAVYEISNAGQLYWFAGLVNGTLSGETQNASANAVLTADIVVNKNVLKSDGTVNEGTFKEWTPIATSASPYTGIFEGQNHTISGLYFKQETSFVGLFSVNSGKIANVGIFDSYFYGQPYKGWQVGGVCGSNTNQGAITNCYNTGIVRGSETVGGVCGSNYGTITNCSNKGNVGEDDESVGGVCGSNYGTITNCNNAGIVSGKMYVGGVCGKNSNGGTVTNCNNTGEVRGTSQYIGGLSGDNDSSSITNCNNTGEVKATGKFVGGLSGGNYNNGTITNCYYDSTVYTGAAIGTNSGTTTKIEGKTTEQYKTGEVAYLLSQGCSTGEGDDTVTYDGSIWGQTIGTDNYPTLGGAKVYKNAIYNGCEGKPGEPVSYAYSNTEKSTYGDHPDADNDGKCDDCGAIIDGIGAKLAGYSLSLTGNIGVNFYMELSNKIIADKDAYMQFTLPNGTITKVLVSEAQTNTTINAEKTYYRFPCEVASYEMTQDIKAQMFDGNGKCGKEYTYTVRDYAQYLIDHVDLYQDAYPFAVAMLNYGACSQKYFNKAVDELANKYLNDNELEILDRFEGYIDNFVANKAENKVLGQFAGLSMVLKSETTLNIFYEPKEGIDVSKLNFIVDGKEITPVKRGQYYILSLENIKANELGNSKKFTVTDGTNTLSGDYCAMMYCYQVLQAQEGTYEDALVTLVKAFSNYAYTAQSICQSN